MKQKDLKQLVTRAMAQQLTLAELLIGSNPQTEAMRVDSAARADALAAVLSAMSGDAVMLHLMGAS